MAKEIDKVCPEEVTPNLPVNQQHLDDETNPE
jgi:hypothetical protein